MKNLILTAVVLASGWAQAGYNCLVPELASELYLINIDESYHGEFQAAALLMGQGSVVHLTGKGENKTLRTGAFINYGLKTITNEAILISLKHEFVPGGSQCGRGACPEPTIESVFNGTINIGAASYAVQCKSSF